MINPINHVSDIELVIRQILIEQSGLSSDFVRNSLSEYGVDLDKTTTNSIFRSLTPEDSCILFEVKTRSNESDVSMTNEKDDKIWLYKSYDVHVIIYGDPSRDLANLIISRLRTDELRQKMYDSGIYLESVSEANELHDFINDVLWIRTDFDINISSKFIINKQSTYSDFARLGTVEIINNN